MMWHSRCWRGLGHEAWGAQGSGGDGRQLAQGGVAGRGGGLCVNSSPLVQAARFCTLPDTPSRGAGAFLGPCTAWTAAEQAA